MIKFLPSLFTVTALLAYQLSPAFGSFVLSHPSVAVWVLGIWGILKNLMRSPLEKSEPEVK